LIREAFVEQTFREDIAASEFGHLALEPTTPFRHLREMLDNPSLSRSDKRALIAAWASDACAVEGRPAWRQIPGSGALVMVDDLLDALRALDRHQS
jgi:hypothetical protein